jgi:hypothetical protein
MPMQVQEANVVTQPALTITKLGKHIGAGERLH